MKDWTHTNKRLSSLLRQAFEVETATIVQYEKLIENRVEYDAVDKDYNEQVRKIQEIRTNFMTRQKSIRTIARVSTVLERNMVVP